MLKTSEKKFYNLREGSFSQREHKTLVRKSSWCDNGCFNTVSQKFGSIDLQS